MDRARRDRLVEAGALDGRPDQDASVRARYHIAVLIPDRRSERTLLQVEHQHLTARRLDGVLRERDARDRAGPRAGGEHHDVRGERAIVELDAGDPAVLVDDTEYFGAGDVLDPGAVSRARKCAHQQPRIDLCILREEETASELAIDA